MKILEKSTFSNKVALVTEGTRGIGQEISKKLQKDGFSVIANYASNDQKASDFANETGIEIVKWDVSNYEQCSTQIKKIYDKHKTIDILINNAGITKDNLTIRMSKDEWDKVININLTSTFLLSKFSIKKMLKKKIGKIINITSVVGHTGNLGQANYSASKGGILSMSKSLSLEYAKKNIMINCIAPGFIQTAMTDKINEDYKNQLKSKIPMDKFGTPQDIANCTAFLCSDLSNYITGETIHVNGGMYFS